MRKIIALTFLFSLICQNLLNAQTPAFPGALGGGKYTTGGRGGEVYEVTNLNDSGPGSLRDAVSKGNRTIVFRVSGIIYLNSKISIKQDNITIAGQTAPGDGICVANYAVNISANNIIIRYMRFRPGDGKKSEDDALNCFGGGYENIIIDHCSMSWSIDETTSLYNVKNVTLQYNIISESLYDSYHVKGKHGYGGIFGGQNSSYLFNLFAHHSSRTPRFNGARYKSQKYADSLEFCNNVIYNWGNINSAYGGEGGKYNMINNYYKAGPATPGNLTTSSTSNKRHRILYYTSFYIEDGDTVWGGKFYINGNYTHGYPDVTADNWTLGVQKDSYSGSEALKAAAKQNQPYAISDYIPVSSQNAYELVIQHAGAILPKRDALDSRIIEELATGKATFEGDAYKTVTSTGVSHPAGIIDSQEDVGGYPQYTSTPAPTDTDHDGMPDEWELANNLNPNDPADRNLTDEDGYTMLEVWLNGIQSSTNSIPLENQQEDIKIFPNPATENLTIENLTNSRLDSVIIYDPSGKKIFQQSHIEATRSLNIDLQTFIPGLYVIHYQINNEHRTKRFIKN